MNDQPDLPMGRQPDAAHPGLQMPRLKGAVIVDSRSAKDKARSAAPMRFMSMFADGAGDRGPDADFALDMRSVTPSQLRTACAYADSLAPPDDDPKTHQRRLDLRLAKLKDLTQAAPAAGKAASMPHSDGYAPLPAGASQDYLASFAAPPPLPASFRQWPQPAAPPVWPPHAAPSGPAYGQAPDPRAVPQFGVGEPARPEAPRPAMAATFYFPSCRFPASYHSIDVQRNDGRAVAVYLVFDRRGGGEPPFLAEDVAGEFGLSIQGSPEAYTVEAPGLVHHFQHYVISTLIVSQVHDASGLSSATA